MPFMLAAGSALYRSNIHAVDAPAPWADPALAAPRGEATAHQDLKEGVRKVVLFGLINNPEPTTSKLREFGYSIQFGGCLISGNDYKYWNAYNRVMIEAGRRQFGDTFVATLENSLT